jgi:hypothetical protein
MVRLAALLAIAITIAACNKKQEDAPAPPPTPPAPEKPAPKVAVLPEHGMLCDDMGGVPYAWWPDGHMTKVDDFRWRITGSDGNAYDDHTHPDSIRPLISTGAGDKIAATPNLPATTHVTYTIEAPNLMLAVVREKDLFQFWDGAWKQVTLPPPAAGDSDAVLAVGHGNGAALWVGRGQGIWHSSDNGATFKEIPGAKNNIAIGITAEGTYVLRADQLVRYSADGKPTKLASFDSAGYVPPVMIANPAARGVVVAIGKGAAYDTVFLADDEAKTATKKKLEGEGGKPLALDNAGRAWIRDGADLVALTATDRHVFAHGTLSNMPYEKGKCSLVGGGFEQLPGEGAKQTATLEVVIHGGAGLDVELCEKPDSRNPKGSPCAGHSDRVAVTLDSSGTKKLTVPVGKYEPAVKRNGAWFVVDITTYRYNSTKPSCELKAGESCTVELAMPKD